MATELRPELRLINTCIQRAFGQTDTTMAEAAIDWDLVESEAIAHGVAPLVAAGLKTALGTAPQNVLGRVRAAHAAAALHSKVFVEPSLELAVSTLHKSGLDPVVLKGGALAYLSYPRPEYRTLGDLDLLVDHTELQEAEQALLDAGFERMDVPIPEGHHHLPPFKTPGALFAVELHDQLLPSPSPYDLDTFSLIARGQVRQLGPVSARVLAPSDALLHVCVHLAYGHRYRWFPLRGLVDVLALTSVERDFYWEEFTARVRSARAAGAVYWPLYLSRKWLAAPIPDFVLAGLAPSPIVQRLVDPIMVSPYVLDGRAPDGAGAAVLYRAIVELSLYGGCSPSAQISAMLRNLFPSPEGVGHLPDEFTHSRLRYGAHLCRPLRLAHGAYAFAQLLAKVRGATASST